MDPGVSNRVVYWYTTTKYSCKYGHVALPFRRETVASFDAAVNLSLLRLKRKLDWQVSS